MSTLSLAARSAALAAVLAGLAGGQALAGQIFSENFSGATPGTYGGAIPGTQFTVTGYNTDIVGVLNGSFFSCVDNPAGNCLDLVGNAGGGDFASTTAFNLVKGDTYTLNFGEVLQGYDAGSSAFTTVAISLGSLSQTETYLGGVVNQVSLTFKPTADESGALLAFDTLIPADSVHGAVLDNITLTQTAGVPEPASWGLMILGAFGLGAMMRRARRLMVSPAA